MKKSNLLGIATLLLVAAGCSENEEFFIEKPSNTTISASIEEIVNTRSDATDSGTFSWTEGDKITVFTSSAASKEFTLNGDEGTSVANFSGTLDNGESIGSCAVYPSGTHSLSGNQLTVNLPTLYDYSSVSAYTANTNSAMMALIEAANPGKAEFKHLAGVLKVKLDKVPANATQFVFTATDKDITGNFVVEDITTAEPIIEAKPLSTNNQVTIKFPKLATETDDILFYVPLPVGTYNGFSIEVKDADDTVLSTYTTGTTNTISRKTLALHSTIVFRSPKQPKTTRNNQT